MGLTTTINPQHMCEGYGSYSVCVCVCLSVIKLAATYLVFKSKMRCHKVPYGDPNACIVWISPTPLSLPVLASFADSKLLDLTLRINRTLSVVRYIW